LQSSLGYQFDIIYKPQKENRPADAVSRMLEGDLQALSQPIWFGAKKLQ